MINYYDILGLPYTSDETQIKKAYRKIAIKYHPDKNPDKNTGGLFNKATEAYETLRDPEKRKKYDASLNLNRIKSKGSNLKVRITVKAEDLIKRKKKSLIFKRKWLCPKCHGTGSANKKLKNCDYCNTTGLDFISLLMGPVKPCGYCNGRGHVPEGILCDTCKGEAVTYERVQKEISLNPLSECYVFKGLGNYCFKGRPGDLIVEVSVQEHPVYKIERLNIKGTINISPVQAVLGDIIELDVFNNNIKVEIPPGTQNKAEIICEGKGIVHERKVGNFKAIINIIIPLIVSKKEKELYQEILKIEKEPACQTETLNF